MLKRSHRAKVTAAVSRRLQQVQGMLIHQHQMLNQQQQQAWMLLQSVLQPQ
jgi:hypothetical protein